MGALGSKSKTYQLTFDGIHTFVVEADSKEEAVKKAHKKYLDKIEAGEIDEQEKVTN